MIWTINCFFVNYLLEHVTKEKIFKFIAYNWLAEKLVQIRVNVLSIVIKRETIHVVPLVINKEIICLIEEEVWLISDN